MCSSSASKNIAQNYTKVNTNTHKEVNLVECVYFTVKDIAKMTGVCTRTVYKWCRTGQLKATKISTRNYRISAAEYQRFMTTLTSK